MKFLQRYKFILCLLAVALVAGFLITQFNSTKQPERTINYRSLLDMVESTDSYVIYRQSYENTYPEIELVIAGGDYKEASEGFERLDDYMNFGNTCVFTAEEGYVTYEITVPEAGYYNLQLSYFPVKGKNNDIGRTVYINGQVPYEEARYLEFTRIWQDAEEIERDSRDNDVRPRQEEAPDWITTYCMDSDGFYTDALYFYFEEGLNTITIESTQEPMVIGQLVIKQAESLPTYEEYKKNNEAFSLAEVESIKIQAEDTLYKSNSTLYPMPDRSSPLTEPQNAAKTRLNMVGGTNWHQNGQWISWKIEVPKDGLYEIAVKYRQNDNQGVTVVRSLEIDGEIPFEEASQLHFYYDNTWQITKLGNEEEAYQFYLTEGVHELKLQVALDNDLAEILRFVDESVINLNSAYRQMLMVIGSSPDTMRDYQLETKVPEALEVLKEQYVLLQALEAYVDVYSQGSKGSQTATIQNLVNQLGIMTENPKKIAKQWSAFKDNIVALSSWQLTMEEQPLEIDYLLVTSSDEELPNVKATLWQSVRHEIQHFLASFVEDYESIGDVYEGEEILEVWILADGSVINSQSGSGRDQATIIKTLVDNYFVPDTGIPVNVKLVNKDVLLSATLAGKGPDVALNVNGKEPLNYALRNAAVNLKQFDDFDEVTEWFYKDALIQFTYEDGVYALPQTMSFHVMFYRKDILEELDLEVPETWDEFYQALAVIQKNNLNVGIYPDYTTYAMYLYQYGGEYYSEDGIECALDSEEAIAAFKDWSGNYFYHDMPIAFDFANRFRTGEMPLAIGDYTNYNYLSVFAPEIKGLWEFTVVPGYEKEDGTIDHTVSAWETASIIMETSDMKQEGWEFLKWWMSADVQTEYGNEIENTLGVAGRVATANLEALANLPWSSADYRQLEAQLSWVKAIPEYPGSYYLERVIKNAFYTVYDEAQDPREVLLDAVITMNDEITSKRQEFGLETR